MKLGLLLAALTVLVLSVSAAPARAIKLTIYDDGISCPGGCDAHVVLNAADNGTRYAHRPGTSRAAKACTIGEACEICFGEADATCMTATYRGGGPRAGTFDFTPAFYQANCSRQDVPAALKHQCTLLDAAATRLGYGTRTNCLANPTDPKCTAVVAAAKAAQDADQPKRDQCLKLGEAVYNKAQHDPNERRANACNYSDLSLGGSGAKRWRLLLPAACRAGTFVDKFGLDCCSADVRFAAANHPECTAFFPK